MGRWEGAQVDEWREKGRCICCTAPLSTIEIKTEFSGYDANLIQEKIIHRK
jgi:hypothetical protein